MFFQQDRRHIFAGCLLSSHPLNLKKERKGLKLKESSRRAQGGEGGGDRKGFWGGDRWAERAPKDGSKGVSLVRRG